MRYRHRARFFRIVNEIALREVICVLPNNLDRFLVRAHGAVRSEAKELRPHHIVRLNREIGIDIETCVREIVLNPDCEMIFW